MTAVLVIWLFGEDPMFSWRVYLRLRSRRMPLQKNCPIWIIAQTSTSRMIDCSAFQMITGYSFPVLTIAPGTPATHGVMKSGWSKFACSTDHLVPFFAAAICASTNSTMQLYRSAGEAE